MSRRTNDQLRVYTYPDRVVVDLEEDTRTEYYFAIQEEGAILRLGMEKAQLSWDAIDQIKRVIDTAELVFRKEDV